MKLKIYFKALMMLLASALVACGSSSSDNKETGVTGQQRNRLSWDSIPAEFNPQTFEENFQTSNINRIYLDMFGFQDDVEVIYTDSLAQGQGYFKIFSVFKKYGSRGNLGTSTSAQSLKLNRYGTYQCSIQSQNGNITQLEGLCFVRMQIFLPRGSEIEVYNVNQLITRRFIAMDNKTFLSILESASFSNDKKAVIEDYLSSYSGLGKSPQLAADQMGTVVGNFNFTAEKFEVLRKLQVYVIDRQNLMLMIEQKFTYFDREEAKRICGL